MNSPRGDERYRSGIVSVYETSTKGEERVDSVLQSGELNHLLFWPIGGDDMGHRDQDQKININSNNNNQQQILTPKTKPQNQKTNTNNQNPNTKKQI